MKMLPLTRNHTVFILMLGGSWLANSSALAQEISASNDIKLDEINVAAPRLNIPVKENPAATSVVGDDVLGQMPRGIGAEEALRLVPGVRIDNQADGERVHLSIRGQGLLTERGIRGIKVLIDGIPLNDPTGFAPDLFDVDWSNVERIEVLRGPASALYGGGAAGGVINITTKSGAAKPLAGEASSTVGSYRFFKSRGAAGGSSETLNYHASASRMSGDGYRVQTRFDAINTYLKLRWTPRSWLRVTGVFAGTEYFNQNAEGLNLTWLREDRRQANPDALKYNEYQRTRRFTSGIVADAVISEHQDVSLTAYYRTTAWKESVPSSIQERTYHSPGLLGQYNLHLGHGWIRNHFSAGADLDMQWFRDKRHKNEGFGVAGSDLQSNQWVSQRGIGLFFIDRVELARGLTLMGGARYDRIHNALTDDLKGSGNDLSGSADFAKMTGRAGIAWNPNARIGLYANWSQGFMAPATEELANNPDAMGGFNRHLVAATSMGGEIGFRGALKRQFTYNLAFFRLDTKNDFGRYRVSSRPLETFYENAGASRRYGVETALSYYPDPVTLIDVAYTYSHFQYTRVTSLFGEFTNTTMPNSPAHQLAVNAQRVFFEHWVVGLGCDGISSWYVDQAHELSANGYMIFHAQLGFRWKQPSYRGEVSIYARNMFGHRYIAFSEPDPDGNSFQPGPTRELFANARFWFGE